MMNSASGHPEPSLQDRVRGVLIGMAAGDRIGGPLRMTLCLAESVNERSRYDQEDLLARYLAWWREGGVDTGPISARVFHLIESHIAGEEAIARTHAESGGLTAGCNPAHRSPPLAMAAFLPEEQLPDLAARQAALTHRDPLAGDVAAATVMLCRRLIQGEDWPSALQQAAVGREERTRTALQGESCLPLRRNGFAPEVLRAAVSFVSTCKRFDSALMAAMEFAGPANYCPVLVGAFAGARWGAEAIPEKMLTHCNIRERVQAAAEALADSWPQSDP
jgi:ADP-ribosylglycohydrolase